MRPSREILAELASEDGFDFDTAFKSLESFGPDHQVSTSDYLAMLEQHHAYGLLFLAELVLDMLETTDSLPKGKELELQNVNRILRLDKASRIHDLIRQATALQTEE